MIPLNRETLKIIKTYLDVIVIIVLAWFASKLYNDNVSLRERELKGAQHERDFWKDAFIKTNGALKNVTQENENPASVSAADSSIGTFHNGN